MIITLPEELEGLQKAAEVVALALKTMRDHAKEGVSTKELDELAYQILNDHGAQSAPRLDYNFPGYTCICLNEEFCHGIPSVNAILKEGDLINIDVSAQKDGYYADNDCSFVIGQDIHNHSPLINASKEILSLAIAHIKDGVLISDVGRIMEKKAKERGFKVVRNLGGHGIGHKLHEEPRIILNCFDPYNRAHFKKNMVIAIETFISTISESTLTLNDGWTIVGANGGFMAQHEHTLVVGEENQKPLILTHSNNILDVLEF